MLEPIIQLEPVIQKMDRKARLLIFSVSVIVFVAVVVLSKVELKTDLSFNVHVFALANAIINSAVAALLLGGLVAVRQGRYRLHRNIMLAAIILSVLFLLSYIAHHLLAGETKFGDADHDGIIGEGEKTATGSMRYVYYFLLLTHIPLAALILPLILFTAYRGLTGEYIRHKKLSRITWPLWLYVAVSGVLVYLLIHPYYN
jgi:putative membrane protein